MYDKDLVIEILDQIIESIEIVQERDVYMPLKNKSGITNQ